MGCFAHKLNLVVSNSLKKTCAAEIIFKIKKIIGFFKHCTNDYDKLKDIVPYKVRSTFYMIERSMQLIDHIIIILLENKRSPPMLSTVEIYSVREFLTILKPFEIATKIVSGEKYITASKIIPVVETIKRKLQEYKPKSAAAIEFNRMVLDNFNT